MGVVALAFFNSGKPDGSIRPISTRLSYPVSYIYKLYGVLKSRSKKKVVLFAYQSVAQNHVGLIGVRHALSSLEDTVSTCTLLIFIQLHTKISSNFCIQMILRELGKYLAETSIHGLNYVATQKHWLAKLFWVKFTMTHDDLYQNSID